MSDTAQLVNTLVGLALMSVLDLVYWLSIEGSHKRLDDPEDDRTLWLDQLPDKIALAPSFYGSSARLSLGRLAVASLLPSQASNTPLRLAKTHKRLLAPASRPPRSGRSLRR